MGLLKRAGDLFYTLRFLRLLTTPFEKTDAFKLGIIDKFGVVNKDFASIKGEPDPNKRDKLKKQKREALTPFIKMVFNLKKLLGKVPGGKSTIASYAAALFLIREKAELSDDNVMKILKESGLETLDFMSENTDWFLQEGSDQLIPGMYKMKCLVPRIINIEPHDELVHYGNRIRVEENSLAGDIFGINIYEATHINTMKKIYITSSEIFK
jgi:hypothetical protein